MVVSVLVPKGLCEGEKWWPLWCASVLGMVLLYKYQLKRHQSEICHVILNGSSVSSSVEICCSVITLDVSQW